MFTLTIFHLPIEINEDEPKSQLIFIIKLILFFRVFDLFV
jgi:hypothetical protein